VQRLSCGDEDLVGRAVDLVAESESRVGDLGNPGVYVEHVIEASGGAISDDRLDQLGVQSRRGYPSGPEASGAESFSSPGLEIPQILGVVHNPSSVSVSEADPGLRHGTHWRFDLIT
jgi:hypothetical protein